MALTVPAGLNAQLVCIPLVAARSITTDTTSAAHIKPGFAGRIVGVGATCPSAGSQPDVDVLVRAGYATYAVSAAMAVWDSSATVVGGVVGTLSTTASDLAFTATSILKLDIDVSGTSGSQDLVAYVWAVRE